MKKQTRTIAISMDNRRLRVKRGVTILEAAQQHGIYIPTLCSHPQLSPFGGCRLCIVEVEGMRGFPTACTTPAEEGMVIRTHTAGVQAERREILQLILSEHTSSCLICDEREACRDFMGTIRKAGATTGCRYCPSDGQCELQEVVDYLELREIDYPISYRHLRVEKEDPFYDRDYNLCILCGRCIRMCQEIRAANVLAFKQRGRHTVIGPAFERTHLEAGCEFCGACVSVCPTGALAEKARKWDGSWQREQITTCALCGLGCQLRLLIKGGEVIGTLPADDHLVNGGQLCVKGRFSVAQLLNGHHRLKRPYRVEGDTRVEMTWKDALEQVVAVLSDCPPGQFGMLISPHCTNEDLYLAQKFVRLAVGSPNIDTSARLFYGPALDAYVRLFGMSAPLSELDRADLILSFGLDARYGRSVVGVKLRQATRRGARLVTIHPRDHHLVLIADRWIRPAAGEELSLLRALVRSTKKRGRGRAGQRPASKGLGEDVDALMRLLAQSKRTVILVGSDFLHHDSIAGMAGAVARLAEQIGAAVMPLPAESNLLGSLVLGAYPELLPGGYPRGDSKWARRLERAWGQKLPPATSHWNAQRLMGEEKLRVLYLVGEMPPGCGRMAEYVIFQNIYPPEASCRADLVLPAAAFTEVDGTLMNGAGRVQRVRKGVPPPGQALPDWDIFCRIARGLGTKGFDYSTPRQIYDELAPFLNDSGAFARPNRRAKPVRLKGRLAVRRPAGSQTQRSRKPFTLYASPAEHLYRGFSLTTRVEGMSVLFPQETVAINPADAERAGISQGDEVIVSWDGHRRAWRANLSDGQPRGTLHVFLPAGQVLETNPQPARVRKKDV